MNDVHPSKLKISKATPIYHSLDHAILDIVETLQNNMDKHYFSCGFRWPKKGF